MAYGFKAGKNIADVYTKTETDTNINNAKTELQTQVNSLLTTKENIHRTYTVNVPATGWSNKTRTVSVSGIKATDTVIVSPAPTSLKAYSNAGMYCSAQEDNRLTFICDEVPEVQITVNVIALGGITA